MNVHAQEDVSRKPRKAFASSGVWELAGSGGFTMTTPVVAGDRGDPVYRVLVLPYVGYFVMNGLELGVNPLGFSWSKDGATTTRELRFMFAPSYNFNLGGRAFPFIEGLAGYTTITTDASGQDITLSGFSWGGRAGVKLPVTARGILIVGVQYLVLTMDPQGATSRNGSDELSVMLGFGVWF
jgi:hypothetical protein